MLFDVDRGNLIGNFQFRFCSEWMLSFFQELLIRVSTQVEMTSLLTGKVTEMLLKSRLTLAAMVVALGFAGTACTDDEPKTEEPVGPAAGSEPMPADPMPASSAVSTEPVYFAFDDFSLNSSAQSILSRLGDELKANQTAVIQIEGHCDERGSIEYNLALGERRAQSVKKFLTDIGIDPARLSIISYGEEKPAAEGTGESVWSRNRRAEFVITRN